MKKIALIGNPNCGKSTLFNVLTGLQQKTGNFPGVTVERSLGQFSYDSEDFLLMDFPGTYSVNPKSEDEKVVYAVLSNPQHKDYPDLVLIVADATNLKRSLFLTTQLIDLGLNCLLALNMSDSAQKKGIVTDTELLSAELGIPVIAISSRTNLGIQALKQAFKKEGVTTVAPFVDIAKMDEGVRKCVEQISGFKTAYAAFHYVVNVQPEVVGKSAGTEIKQLMQALLFDANKAMQQESILRYKVINQLWKKPFQTFKVSSQKSITEKADKLLIHPVFGLSIFLGVLFVVFQFLFTLSAYPMEWIDALMLALRGQVTDELGDGLLVKLFSDGVLAGVTGILVFIPQIAILFMLIAIMEESGYMVRVSFLMDRLMRPFGLNGRSVIPLMGGVACAVPSILGTRSISNYKERLLTILILPLISCSARLPVYSLMIAISIPQHYFFGFIGSQGLVLLLFYLIGIVSALALSFVLHKGLFQQQRTAFVMEMPVYRLPQLRSVGITVINKVREFVVGAGGIILAISIILWTLSNFGPASFSSNFSTENRHDYTVELEQSFAGIAGKKIEPFIAPLGFDWRIGISLITSFAAREVFVGTMHTLFNVDETASDQTLMQAMKSATNSLTHQPLFSFAGGISLMLFYAFALQCMSTLAVVKSETLSWKWPLFQFVLMGSLAYLMSWLAFSLLN